MANNKINPGKQSLPVFAADAEVAEPCADKMWAGKKIAKHDEEITESSRSLRRGDVDKPELSSLKDKKCLVKDVESLSQVAVNGDIPFNEFWEPVDGDQKSHMDTVDHQLMMVKSCKDNKSGVGERPELSGKWHVKGPGLEKFSTRLKRFFQGLVYGMVGKKYKGKYYNDPKLLIQKEIAATNIYRAVKSCGVDNSDDFQSSYGAHFTNDSKTGRSYGAFKHLEGYQDAGQVDNKVLRDMRDNPASELVIRRFFLGDEDYLKMNNYMYDPNTSAFHSIDFGMSFYNKAVLSPDCTFEQFKKIMLKPSKKHRLQYRRKMGKDTLLGLIKSRESEDTHNAILSGLSMVALVGDEALNENVAGISNPQARDAMWSILASKRQQAQCILYRSFPEKFAAYENVEWPAKPSRKVMNHLV
ncbi:MAG: hypothetical protein QS721_08200 [Candidatus Endonucleobacter sp. (ex Gigantidas childressi)]|nr:hypothetical protein [Candidatus Endonucleobacter sp. (ex Gigantidas childressi)]